MAFESDSPLDSLWKEYARAFQAWDDLTLARWLAQTLGQLEGARGGSRIRSSARIGSWRSSRMTGKSGSSDWPHRGGLHGIALLPRAVPAVAHARCARIGFDLPALQRNARAV